MVNEEEPSGHLEYDDVAWQKLDFSDLWVYDKLILAKYLGHVAAPAGVPVPSPGKYIVRPITNLLGMGKGAEIINFIDTDTSHLPAGTFWCEVFTGRHLSVDVVNGKTEVIYEGFPRGAKRFHRWEKVNEYIVHPEFIYNLSKKYGIVNYESIGGKIIEIHLRPNPDWINHKADELIPLWKGDTVKIVDDEDADRIGFIVINRG